MPGAMSSSLARLRSGCTESGLPHGPLHAASSQLRVSYIYIYIQLDMSKQSFELSAQPSALNAQNSTKAQRLRLCSSDSLFFVCCGGKCCSGRHRVQARPKHYRVIFDRARHRRNRSAECHHLLRPGLAPLGSAEPDPVAICQHLQKVQSTFLRFGDGCIKHLGGVCVLTCNAQMGVTKVGKGQAKNMGYSERH